MAVQLILVLLTIPGYINAEEGLVTTTGYSTRDDLDQTQVSTSAYICQEHACDKASSADLAGEYRYCHCDELCVTYGDCCPDIVDSYPTVNLSAVGTTTSRDSSRSERVNRGDRPSTPRSQRSRTVDDYSRCIQTRDFYADMNQPRLGHRLTSLCPIDWDDPTGIRELCQNDVGFVSSIRGTPVSGPNNYEYKNVYCAICHGVAPEHVSYWVSRFFNKLSITVLNPSTVNHLDSNPQVRQALVKILSPYNSEESRILGIPPKFNSPRSCVVLDVTSCPLTNRGEEDPCSAHFAPIVLNGTVYQNKLCIECQLFPSRSPENIFSMAQCPNIIQFLRFGSMAALLIFSDRAEVETTTSRTETLSGGVLCSPSQVYDPYIEQCRNLLCPSGYVLTENSANCVQVQANAANTEVAIDVAIKLTVTGSFPDVNKSVPNSIASWETVVHKSVDDFLLHVLLKNKAGNDLPRNSDTFCNDHNLTWACSSVDPGELPPRAVCTQHNIFRCYVNVSYDCDAPPTDRLTYFNHMDQDTCFQQGLWNNTIHLDAFTVATPCSWISNESRNQTNPSSGDRSTHFFAKILTWEDSLGEFKETNLTEYCEELNFDCPRLKFPETDYVFTGALNDSIKLTGYSDAIFPNGQYKLLDNGSVEVCSFLLKAAPFSGGDLDELVQLILTVAGSSISLIGLLVTITTYAAFPALRRNVAGKSLMSLVASLFLAQATMLTGFNMNDIFELCRACAIAGHFFWLSAFFWMNLLAIDIYRTFGVGIRLKNANTNNRSFGLYAIYGWGSPTVIVSVCVILSSCDCVDLDIHYGRTDACWLGGGTANLVAFGVPVALIICTNAVMFALTIIGVRITRRASGKMNLTQGQGCTMKRASIDLFLYVKLSAIMGFTWIFGFIASLFNIPAFWYPYIVLNSLQGALVCLAFVCNRRVIGMWMTKLRFRNHDNSFSNSSSARALKKSLRATVTLSEQIATESSSSIKMTKI